MNPRPLTEDERNMVLEKLKHIGTKQTATVNTDFDPIDNIHKKPVQFSDLLPDSGINNRYFFFIRRPDRSLHQQP